MGFFSGMLGNAFGSVLSSVGGSLLDKFTGGSSGGSGLDIGSLVGAGSNLLGGFLSSKSTEDANKANLAMAQAQLQWQQQYAKNRLQWQVEDAKNAGLHPMVAAGLSPVSFSPVSAQQSPIDYDWVGQAGQSLSYAAAKAKDQEQQQQAWQFQQELAQEQITGVRLDNELKVMQILSDLAKLNQTGPAAPSLKPKTLIEGQNDSPFLDKAIVSNGFRLDEKGRKIDIIPSDDVKSRTEDVFGVEWMPFIDSIKLNFNAKVLGEPFAGHWWHEERGEFLPYPPKEKKNARQDNQNSYYHNSWRYR